jgi:putative copper resistance protein D
MAHLGAPLLSALYGQMLALKLVFVTLAVLLGGSNRLIYLPRLESATNGDGAVLPHAQRGFDRLLAVEALAMVAVLVVAAVLGHTYL